MNHVALMGFLTRDPEMTYLPNGTAVAKTAIAMNRKWTAEGGEKKEEVTFVDLTAFGKTAEIMGEWLKKGSATCVEGRLKQDTWDDKQTGQKRSKLHVIVERMNFVPGKRDEASGPPADGGPTPMPHTQRPEVAPTAVTRSFRDEDGVPF